MVAICDFSVAIECKLDIKLKAESGYVLAFHRPLGHQSIHGIWRNMPQLFNGTFIIKISSNTVLVGVHSHNHKPITLQTLGPRP